MSKLEKMRERYDEIPIPEELSVRVQQEIQRSRSQQEAKNNVSQRHRFQSVIRSVAAAAAAVCILFTAALNTSPVFAMEAAQLPVIGGIARVLTFRSYETEKDNIGVSVEIPTIEMVEKDTKIAVDGINQEILARCNEYADNAVLRAEEYRTAFLETGGTLEEWAKHNIKITVSYEIKQQSNDYLSFVVRGTENWTNACDQSNYYNLDLKTGKLVSLEDLLGSDYAELANRSIRQQISERQNAGETFFTAEQGGFTGISDDTKFYMNENNNPVIVFEKYEIAPGSSGEIEFEIDAKAILSGYGEHRQPEQETQQSASQEDNQSSAVEKTVETDAVYEDNFAVDSEAAKEFAEKVKDAAARKDLEALAELTAFPVYVGLPDVNVVETKEDLLKLGADTVFAKELLNSVKEADIENLQPSKAGFSISDGGTANINFGVVDGALAITGINY